MGKYVQGPWGGRRSVAETLAEAEEDHYLDCPNAETGPRLAALILDAIFIVLMGHALNKITGILIDFSESPDARLSGSSLAFFQSVKTAFMVLIWYYSQLWSVARYGASPGKLFLGLRVIESKSGSNLSFPKVFFREVFAKLLISSATCGLALLVPFFRKDGLALHDLLSGTVVKKVRPH